MDCEKCFMLTSRYGLDSSSKQIRLVESWYNLQPINLFLALFGCIYIWNTLLNAITMNMIKRRVEPAGLALPHCCFSNLSTKLFVLRSFTRRLHFWLHCKSGKSWKRSVMMLSMFSLPEPRSRLLDSKPAFCFVWKFVV